MVKSPAFGGAGGTSAHGGANWETFACRDSFGGESKPRRVLWLPMNKKSEGYESASDANF